MPLADWQLDLRALGYDGDLDYESLKEAIEGVGVRLESLVQLPAKAGSGLAAVGSARHAQRKRHHDKRRH